MWTCLLSTHMCICLPASVYPLELFNPTDQFQSHTYKCNHLKDTKILSDFMTICNCPRSMATSRAETAMWAEPYQAPRIHLQQTVWMQKKLRSEYPAYYTSEDLTRRQIQRNLLPWLTELPLTSSEAWLFCRSHPLLYFLNLCSSHPLGMPVLLRTIRFLTFLPVSFPCKYQMQARS